MNAIGLPEIATPRPVKVLMIAAVLLGELFVTGYLFNSQDDKDLSSNTREFVGQAAIYSLASALLMVPLKLITSRFLVARPLLATATRAQIEATERKRGTFQVIGCILILIWIALCSWGIVMFALNFTENALDKWMITYFATFLVEMVIIFQLKILLKMLIGLLLLKITRSRCMLTIAGHIAGKLIDCFIRRI